MHRKQYGRLQCVEINKQTDTNSSTMNGMRKILENCKFMEQVIYTKYPTMCYSNNKQNEC